MRETIWLVSGLTVLRTAQSAIRSTATDLVRIPLSISGTEPVLLTTMGVDGTLRVSSKMSSVCNPSIPAQRQQTSIHTGTSSVRTLLTAVSGSLRMRFSVDGCMDHASRTRDDPKSR